MRRKGKNFIHHKVNQAAQMPEQPWDSPVGVGHHDFSATIPETQTCDSEYKPLN